MTKRDGKQKQTKRAKKEFDCVEMKHRIQAEIYEEIKNLTPKQELEYWRKSVEKGPWGERWREVHARAKTGGGLPTRRSRRKKSGKSD